MPYICYDCKLGYGHPLLWCSGCGRKMIKVKAVDWNILRKDDWKLEGDKGLHEYYLNGKLVDKSYESLAAEIKRLYPELWKLFDLPQDYNGEGPTPANWGWNHYDSDRKLSVILSSKDKGLTLYIKKPIMVYRLKGSNLPIDGVTDEQPFKYKDNGG